MSAGFVELLAARWVLDAVHSEDLADLATDLLERGVKSDWLSEAASAGRSDVRRARDLLDKALRELQIELPDEQDAIYVVARHMMRQIVDGAIDPIDGAREISRIGWRASGTHDLDVFDAAAYDGVYTEGQTIDTILRGAAELLDRPRFRTWVRLQASLGMTGLSGVKPLRSLDPESLPISDGLRNDLKAWVHDFKRATPGPGTRFRAFPSPKESEAFTERGARLARQIQRQLGDDWHIVYYPEPSRYVS